MDLKDMKGAVLLIAVIALIGAATAIGLVAFRDDIASDMDTITIVNESLTYTNNTYSALTNNAKAILTCIEVRNNTANADILPASIYTCTNGLGIKVIADEDFNITAGVNVSYSYSDGDYAYNTSEYGLEGVLNTTNYLGTIGTIIGVSVLIGIVVLAFVFIKR